MSARFLAAVAVALVHVAGVAKADTVILKDGQRIDGVVVEEGKTVKIKLDVGTISFAASEVAKIERADTPVHTYERRRASIRAGDVRALMKLADWARANGLSDRAYSTYREVLSLDKDHAGARRALGHVRRGGVWVDPEEEAKKARAAELSARARAVRASSSQQAPARKGRSADTLCPPPSRFGPTVTRLRPGTSLFVWTKRYHPQQKCKPRQK